MASERSCSVAMSDPRVMSQYRNFVIMLGGASNTPDVMLQVRTRRWCSFAVHKCMGRKLEVNETVNKDFNFARQFLRPRGMCHACYTLDTSLRSTLPNLSLVMEFLGNFFSKFIFEKFLSHEALVMGRVTATSNNETQL